MEVIAEDADGNTVRKRTRYLNNDRYPDWNQWLYFGNRAWKKYKVRIYDGLTHYILSSLQYDFGPAASANIIVAQENLVH